MTSPGSRHLITVIWLWQSEEDGSAVIKSEALRSNVSAGETYYLELIQISV